MKKYVVIVAGGKGLRMGSEIPKQFLELNGKPVLMHTIEAFIKFDAEIRLILVLPKDQFNYWDELCQKHQTIFVRINVPPQPPLPAGGEHKTPK